MADLTLELAGISSPNPFWLASAPPTDSLAKVHRAFEAGWGGVVWKTLGIDPPVINVNGPRYGAWHGPQRAVMGFNNIELISDRPLADNLREIAAAKRLWPDRAMVVSVMLPLEPALWPDVLRRIEDSGADGIELNLGCPHGMSERGMGSAVGQNPALVAQATACAKATTRLPVLVKLTPNVTDITQVALAAQQAGADGLSLINTINSIMAVDLDAMAPIPTVGGQGSHGGYCGPAVKPIALHMVAATARCCPLPLSAIGGISTWRDAAEFLTLGATGLQVCTAAMVYGLRIIDDLLSGLSDWMDSAGYANLPALSGRALPQVVPWERLDLHHVAKARIVQEKCIACGRCWLSCEDTSHQAINHHQDSYSIREEDCIGCALCQLVCPVPGAIIMERLAGGIDPRTGETISSEPLSWQDHPNNPARRST